MKRIYLLLLSGLYFLPSFSQTITATLNAVTVMPVDFLGYNPSNVINSENPYWNDTSLIKKFNQLDAGSLRFPGGDLSNFWDWRTGYFKSVLPAGVPIKGSFESVAFKDNTMNRYKTLIESSVTAPLFCLNILTSNKYYEAASLYYANYLNIPLKNIEFGNEFYLEKDEYLAVFNNAESYAIRANEWASYLKSIPNGSSYKIAAVGAIDKYPMEPAFSRQNSWLARLMPNIGNNISAITMHDYAGSGLSSVSVSTSNLPTVMASPFLSYTSLIPELNLIRSYGKEAWMTEYNLFDRGHCLQGTWASGLFVAAKQLTYNEDTVIKMTNCYTLLGSAVWGMIFSDSSAFDMEDFYYGGTNCLSNKPYSNVFEFSAGGSAMSLLAKAQRGATTRRKFSFTNNPQLPGMYDAIYGWQFDSPVKTAAVILNLDSVDRTITIDVNAWNVSGGSYMQLYAGPGGPLALIKGNATSNPGVNQIASTGSVAATQTILLRKYSITYLEKKKSAVTLKISKNKICSNTTTTAGVKGGSSYNWTGTGLSSINSENSVVQFTAPTVLVNTVYTITVTDISGVSASATITVYPKPVLTSTINYNQVCSGFPVKLSAELSGANANNFQSFIWIQDDGKEITDCQNPIVNVFPEKSTTYFVLATDGNCWSNIDSQKVVVNAIANAGISRFVCTDSLPYTITAQNILNGFSYSWYSGDTLLNTGTTLTVSPSAKSTYKLFMVNNADGMCTSTDSITLDPIKCCWSSDTTVLTFGTNVTIKQFADFMKSYCLATGIGTAGDNSLSDFNKEIVFNGVLNVDRAYTFYNCPKLKFSERSEIRFNTNYKVLTFKKCKLSAASCSGKMWTGLKANLFSTVLTIDSSIISDAEIGVYAEDDSKLNITNTTFLNNNIGISIYDFIDNFEGTIKADSFLYSSLLPPHAGQRAFCGVKLEDIAGIIVGDSSMNVASNYFANHEYGIYSPGSSFAAFNNKFENFQPDNNSNINEGTAIYCFNAKGAGSLTDTAQMWPKFMVQIGNSGGGPKGNIIQNCKYGIYCINTEMIAKGNTISAERAIKNVDGVFNTMEASYNTITNAKSAIEFITPHKAVIDISFNTITTDTAFNNAVLLAAVRVADDPINQSVITADDNIINVNGTHGIYISNSDFGKYTDNKIYLRHSNLTFDTYAFKFEDCDSADFSCNLAKGTTNAQINKKIGLQIINSDQWRLRCCNIDKVDLGMEFLGNCDLMQLRNNEYYYSNIGFSVGANGLTSGKIGPQPQFPNTRPLGNKFFGQYTSISTQRGVFGTAATRSVNSYLAGGALDTSRFYVYNGDSIQIPFPNILSGTGTSVTPFYSNKVPNACNASCSHPNPQRPKNRVVKREMNPVVSDDADEILVSEETLNAIAVDLFEVRHPDALQYSSINMLYEIAEQRLSEGNNLGELKSELSNGNYAKFYDVKKLMKQIGGNQQTNINGNLMYAIQVNNSIVPQNILEQNDKDLNLIVLKNYLGKHEAYSKNEIGLLWQIANQCPYTGGDAVFKARSLFSKINAEVNYDDLVLCNKANDKTKSLNEINSTAIKVYPNPAKEVVNLSYNLNPNSSCNYLLTDVTGRIVLKSNLNPLSTLAQINISNLQQGIYTLEIIADGSRIYLEKIVVIK